MGELPEIKRRLIASSYLLNLYSLFFFTIFLFCCFVFSLVLFSFAFSFDSGLNAVFYILLLLVSLSPLCCGIVFLKCGRVSLEPPGLS